MCSTALRNKVLYGGNFLNCVNFLNFVDQLTVVEKMKI